MSRGRALAALSPLAAEQWGMVTAAQARELGVTRLDLNRLVQDDTLERIEPGATSLPADRQPPDPDLDRCRRRGSSSAQAPRLRGGSLHPTQS